MATVQKFVSKRSESCDAGGVRGLVTRHTEALFGRINPEYIIEHASLGISLLSGEGNLVGHMSLTDTPPTLPKDWTSWLTSVLNHPSPANTLFLCLFVAKDNFHQGAVTEILRTVYMTAPLLQYLLLVTPTNTQIGAALSTHFTSLCCQDDLTVYVTYRHAHFPSLFIRPACVEDCDDLLPILLQHSHDITSLYGDYFLPELIASQDKDHRTIVAEVDGRAVGLMSVTTRVDVDLLSDSYLLEPYHLLRKPHPQDEIILPSHAHTSTAHTGTAHTSTAHTGTAHTNTASTSTTHTSTAHTGTAHTSTASTSTAHTSTAHTGTAHTNTASTSTAHTGTAHTSTAHTATAHTSTAHTATGHTSTAHTSTASTSTADIDLLSQENCTCPDSSSEPPLEEVQGSKVNTRVYSLKGEACALAIQLFAIDERYEMRSLDFLPAVFKLFPDHHFLLLTQPHSSGDLPLLAHFTEAVPTRPGTSLPQELFLTHKASLLDSFTVREATTSDLPALETLTSDLSSREDMLGDVSMFLRGRRDDDEVTPLIALVGEVDHQLVALAVLRVKEDMEFTRSHYNIEDFIYYNYHEPCHHSHIHHLVLNPAFSPHAKHFLKEILRLSGSSCLYYHLSPDSQPKPQSLICALHCLVPIKARRQVVYPQGLGMNSPLPEVTEVKPPFALYHTNRKLTFEPKISVNCRVVVVGASTTATSLLETLIFCPHLHISNLVLISSTGLTSPPTIGLDTWINTVQGTLTAINRTDQCVEVLCEGCKCIVHYDWLVLTCGVEYSAPALKGLPPPTQVITTLPAHTKGPCAVYGSGVDAYASVNHLLTSGVAPDMITMLRPHTLQWTDGVIATRVSEALSLTAINELSEISLSEWIVGEDGLEAVAIVTSTGHAQTVPCNTLIYQEDKTVNTSTFKALNDSCLVFDNRLVISTDHSTNDPHILAAGPLTKYSRQYRADNCSHADFNSEEVGLRLALTLLSKLDPTFDPTSDDTTDPLLIPRYTQPVVVGVALPGGLHYLHISSPPTPGITPPSHDKPPDRKGRELVTDSPSGYFSLHISEYGRVDELCLLSTQHINDRDNYTCLYNIHEKYLNNLLERYDQGLVSDLYNYLREPWVCAVVHDRFPDLMQEVMEDLSLVPHETNSETSIEAVVREMFDAGSPLTSNELSARFHTSSARALVSQRLSQYLNYNKQQLPMFTQPDVV